jgi:hypothetical protein
VICCCYDWRRGKFHELPVAALRGIASCKRIATNRESGEKRHLGFCGVGAADEARRDTSLTDTLQDVLSSRSRAEDVPDVARSGAGVTGVSRDGATNLSNAVKWWMSGANASPTAQ